MLSAKLGRFFLVLLMSSLAFSAGVGAADRQLTRAQALKALEQASAEARFTAVVRLAEIGTMADASRVALRLRDDNE